MGPNRDLKHSTALSKGARSRAALTSNAPRDLHWLEENIPCQKACPAGTDVAGYLEAVYQGDFSRAYEINLRDNIFPAVLGRVCSRPCESACRHGWPGNGDPVAICFSKRSAADFQHQGAVVVIPPLFHRSGKTVAVIGAGCAGLAAARELTCLGHEVTVFEKHRSPGGMLNQGIPEFRLPRDIIRREIDQILELGVKIHCGMVVGIDVSLEQLTKQYDALVIAAGTLRPNMLGLAGEELSGVEHGLRFLLETNESGRTRVGHKTLVIGGGYTAMDCARMALRLGAQTAVYYRRGRADMVVLPGELDELCLEGGTIEEHCSPVAFLGSKEAVRAVRFIRTQASVRGDDGRRIAVDIPGSEFEVEADTVILATGQFPQTSWIDDVLRPSLVKGGWLASGHAVSTQFRNIFAAGDFALGASTLIQAIGHAKRCARSVDAFLMGENRVREVTRIGPVFQSKSRERKTTGRSPEMNRIPIFVMPTRPLQERTPKAEVELGYPREIAKQAASRCYLCHYKFEILDERCVLCDECLKVKPVSGCIVEVSALQKNEREGVIGYDPVVEGLSPSLYYSRLWIDQSQCIRCGACESVCPTNAITIQKVSLETNACGPDR